MDIIVKEQGLTLLFLCKCGGNISNNVDFEAIKEWGKSQPNIQIIVTGDLLCSPQEKELFSKIISGKNKYINNRKISNIVVAACSPKQHEKSFQNLLEKEGLNISQVQMANIREQCAWVTSDKKKATEKAITLINGAVNRVKKAEELKKQTMKVLSDVLIIGGGIAGIQSALTLSKAGRKVYLVEKNISIGGTVIKTEEVAPNMECAPCLLAPILSQVKDDHNIEVISNAEVTDVLGFFGNFTVNVKKKARYVKENCISCEECFDVCPVSIKNDFHQGMGERKAIYSLFAGSVPAAAAIDRDNCKHFISGDCDECVKVCPFQSIDFEDKDEQLSLQVGSIIVATGLSSSDPSKFENLGYRKIDNVYTMVEFERLASSNGPTGGEVKLKNGEKPQSIAVIHCAGSLNENGLPYCSTICCTNACKVGALLRIDNPDIKVTNIHNDLVFTTPSHVDFYKKQIEKGTEFLKTSNLSSVKITEDTNGKINVSADDIKTFETDMVVLSTGLKPSEGTKELSVMLNLDIDKYGYFKSDHELVHKTGTIIDGIYMAGCAMQPDNVANSITQGHAAAGDILSKLIPGKEIELEVLTSYIDEEICAGCKLCIAVCPFKAISFDEEKAVSIVNEALCRGCGTCAATCPSRACHAKHFLDDQIYAELGGILNE